MAEQRQTLHHAAAPVAPQLSAVAVVELRGWAALAVAALAIAGVYAVLMIASRAPGAEDSLPWMIGMFHKGLVIHVVFSFVVWFLAVLGGLCALTSDRLVAILGEAPSRGSVTLGRGGLLLAIIACPLLFLPAFLASADPSLNNYVPVLMHPLYYVGLVLLALGVALPVVRLLRHAWRARQQGPFEPLTSAAIAAAAIYLVALFCMAVAGVLQRHEALSPAVFDDLFWGGGHVLQFANTALLCGVWAALLQVAHGRQLISPRLLTVACGVLVAAALVAPVFYVLFEPFVIDQRQAFTLLQYALAPSTLMVAVAALVAMPGARSQGALPWRHPAWQSLVLSWVIFGLGGVFGLFVDGLDTRTPSHYHGMIGGVTLAYMGLFYGVLLPALDRPVTHKRWVTAQIGLYAVGQVLQCIGLFMAAAPRKTAGAEQGLQTSAEIMGMSLNRSGGGLAVLGGVLFVVLAARALIRRPDGGVEEAAKGKGVRAGSL